MCKMRKCCFELKAGKCAIGRSTAKSEGTVGEFYIAWRVVTLYCRFHVYICNIGVLWVNGSSWIFA